jgi:hypothetical protein
MEKEHWISQILDSTNSITPVSPPMGLFGKIENKIKQQQIVSPTWIWLAAASIALLILLNAKVIYSGKAAVEKSAVESLANSISNSNQLY